MTSRITIDPALVLSLARLLRTQATSANDAANTTAHVVGAVGLVAASPANLDGIAEVWRMVSSILESRALLAAGFRLNLAANHIGPPTAVSSGRRAEPSSRDPTTAPVRRDVSRSTHNLVSEALVGGLTHADVFRILTAFATLTDLELRAVWIALDSDQQAALIAGLLTQDRLTAVVRLASISAPLVASNSLLDGPELLVGIAAWLPLLEVAAGSVPDGHLSYDELVAAASVNSTVLPEWLALATSTLASSPAFFDAVAWSRKGLQKPEMASRLGPPVDLFEVRDTVTAADLAAAVIQIDIVSLLANPLVFDRLDAAKTGQADGHVSIEDVEIAIAEEWYDSRDTALLEQLVASGFYDRLKSTDDRAKGTQISTGRLYWDDIAAQAIGLHAFANSPTRAQQFLDWLPKPYEDATGHTHGLDIRLSTDDGVRALATAALAGTNSMAEQVMVIAALPESQGAERNRLITLYYSGLGLQTNAELNNHVVGDPMDPTSPGHSGANWMLLAPWASNSIRPALRGDKIDVPWLPDQAPSTADRQQLADGNQTIFGDIAPRFAAFVDAAKSGAFDNPDSFVDFFTTSTLPDGRPLFADGHNQLRDGLAHLAAAITEPDPVARQRLVLLSNALLATHEQASVQPILAALTDFGVGDDGIVRGIAGEVGSYLIGGDAVVATGFMTLTIGVDDPGRIALGLGTNLDPDQFDKTNNLIIGDSLTGILDPAGRETLTVAGTKVHLRDGPEQRTLPNLGGWGDPPAGSGRVPFPTSAKTWYDIGTNNVVILPAGEPPVFVTETRGTTDGSNLAGTGAVDWGEPDDRMWHIANLFHQSHTEPKLWTLQHELGLNRTDDEMPAFDWLPPHAKAEFGAANSRNPRG